MDTKMPSVMEEISLRGLAKTHPIDSLLIATQRGYDVQAVFKGMFLFIETLEILPLPEPDPKNSSSVYWTEVGA